VVLFQSLAVYFFVAGCLVGLGCGTRIFIRIVQWREGPQPWNPWKGRERPSWDPINILLRVQLKDTLALELLGLTIALPTVQIAMKYLFM
jgi:hypothetical protein